VKVWVGGGGRLRGGGGGEVVEAAECGAGWCEVGKAARREEEAATGAKSALATCSSRRQLRRSICLRWPSICLCWPSTCSWRAAAVATAQASWRARVAWSEAVGASGSGVVAPGARADTDVQACAAPRRPRPRRRRFRRENPRSGFGFAAGGSGGADVGADVGADARTRPRACITRAVYGRAPPHGATGPRAAGGGAGKRRARPRGQPDSPRCACIAATRAAMKTSRAMLHAWETSNKKTT
jgi:hypothetical protein